MLESLRNEISSLFKTNSNAATSSPMGLFSFFFFFVILFSTEHLNPIVELEKYSSCGEHNTISHHCAFDLK